MKAEPLLLPLLRARRLAAVAMRQRALAKRGFGVCSPLHATPIERVMRRAVIARTVVDRRSVHHWLLQPVLPIQQRLVERQLHVERTAPSRPTLQVLQRLEHETRHTMRERMIQHTASLVQRHASVAPVARAMRRAEPAVAAGTQPQPTWLAALAVPPVPTTVLAPAGRAAAKDAQRPAEPTRRDEPSRWPPALPPGTAMQPMLLPPQEMSRVTDHVMQQFDRRMLSLRERTGRH